MPPTVPEADPPVNCFLRATGVTHQALQRVPEEGEAELG